MLFALNVASEVSVLASRLAPGSTGEMGYPLRGPARAHGGPRRRPNGAAFNIHADHEEIEAKWGE